jgi:uncharacterized membrane protein YoaK (UPF0700 family)
VTQGPLWWADIERDGRSNLLLGSALAFVAGATNAGGFLAVGQYTSHMSGILSGLADHVVLGQLQLAVAAAAMLVFFILGAMTTAWMVNWAQRRHMRSSYARPLILEAALLLVFGLFGARVPTSPALVVPLTALLLCFLMGLQNAVISKVSHAEIRTTHVTGLLTDIGIELGKLSYVHRSAYPLRVVANHNRLAIHLQLVGCFALGALLGALGFKWVGFATTIPLAAGLLLLSWGPFQDDLRRGQFSSAPKESQGEA